MTNNEKGLILLALGCILGHISQFPESSDPYLMTLEFIHFLFLEILSFILLVKGWRRVFKKG